MHTLTLTIDKSEPVKVERRGGARWYIGRDANGRTVRSAGVMRHHDGWCVHARLDGFRDADGAGRESGLTFREADRIARVFVRSGRVLTADFVRSVRPDGMWRDDAAANDAARPLLVAFGFVTR